MSFRTPFLLLFLPFLLVAFLIASDPIMGSSLSSSASSLLSSKIDVDNKRDSVSTDIRNITLIADDHAIMKISPDNLLHPGGIEYKMMTFNGTVPGPLLKFKENEWVRITLINDCDLVHSINLHGITGPSRALSGPVGSGGNKTWILHVDSKAPNVFMYHCDADNLNSIWEHVGGGMYGSLLITSPTYDKKHPAAKEF